MFYYIYYVIHFFMVSECSALADIVFILDVSGSIREKRFRLVQEFVIDVVNELEVHQDRTRIGLVKFSTDIAVEFYLNEFHVSGL